MINLDDKISKGTHWSHYLLTKIYIFDAFGIKYLPQEVPKKIKDKSIIHNIFRIQDNESIVCVCVCVCVCILLYRFHRICTFRKNFVSLCYFIFSKGL